MLPLVAGPEPRPMFRVSLHRGPGEPNTADHGALGALLIDVSEEFALRRQLFDRNHVLTVLNDIGAALSATLDLDVLAERIYEQTSRIMRTANFYIALHDRATSTVSFPLYVDARAKREAPSRPFANGLTEYVLRTARPLLLNHDIDTRARALGIEPRGAAATAWLGVPILADGEATGVIALQDYAQAEVFTLQDLEVLTIIAAQAGAAIKTAHLFASARQAYRELSETQARLLESERLRGVTETVGALNHEINNPLAAIAGNAQLLLRGNEPLTVQARTKLESILESARRIQRVTTKMTTLIQATTMPYPGVSGILDVHRSVSREDQTPPPGDGKTSGGPSTERPAA
jgi:GAF domain-containing protein